LHKETIVSWNTLLTGKSIRKSWICAYCNFFSYYGGSFHWKSIIQKTVEKITYLPLRRNFEWPLHW